MFNESVNRIDALSLRLQNARQVLRALAVWPEKDAEWKSVQVACALVGLEAAQREMTDLVQLLHEEAADANYGPNRADYNPSF